MEMLWEIGQTVAGLLLAVAVLAQRRVERRPGAALFAASAPVTPGRARLRARLAAKAAK